MQKIKIDLSDIAAVGVKIGVVDSPRTIAELAKALGLAINTTKKCISDLGYRMEQRIVLLPKGGES